MPDYVNPFMPSGKRGHASINKPAAFLDAGLFKYVWSLVSPSTKELRELNICETKKCKIKVYELDLENWKTWGKIANEQIFIAFTL